MTVYERHDLPPGRTAESFRYRVEFLWDDSPVEDYYTDSEAERDRLVRAATDQEYGVRVT